MEKYLKEIILFIYILFDTIIKIKMKKKKTCKEIISLNISTLYKNWKFVSRVQIYWKEKNFVLYCILLYVYVLLLCYMFKDFSFQDRHDRQDFAMTILL